MLSFLSKDILYIISSQGKIRGGLQTGVTLSSLACTSDARYIPLNFIASPTKTLNRVIKKCINSL